MLTGKIVVTVLQYQPDHTDRMSAEVFWSYGF